MQIWACLLGQLLEHLINQNQEAQILNDIRALQEKHQSYKMENTPTDVDLLAVLHSQSDAFEQTYVVFDALDNYATLQQKQNPLLSAIRKLPLDMKLLVTTRSGSPVTNQLRDIVGHELPVRAHRSDVEDYVVSRIKEDENLRRLVQQGESVDAGFKSRVIDSVRRGSKEMFVFQILSSQTVSDNC